VLTYDIRKNESSTEPILMLIGSPMGAAGFATLAGHSPTARSSPMTRAAWSAAEDRRHHRIHPRRARRRPASGDLGAGLGTRGSLCHHRRRGERPRPCRPLSRAGPNPRRARAAGRAAAPGPRPWIFTRRTFATASDRRWRSSSPSSATGARSRRISPTSLRPSRSRSRTPVTGRPSGFLERRRGRLAPPASPKT
jgi:hypothetical protein